MTKAWKPLSEKRGFNRLVKKLKRERKNAQPVQPASALTPWPDATISTPAVAGGRAV